MMLFYHCTILEILDDLEAAELIGEFDHIFDYDGQLDLDEEEVDQIINIMEKDDNFKHICLRQYQLNQMCSIFDVQTPPYETCFKVWSEMQGNIDGKIYTFIYIDLLKEFFSRRINNLELRMILAINSIVGLKQSYAKTNRAHVRARMLGYNKFSDLPSSEESIIQRLESRYYFDQIMSSLVEKAIVTKYPGRGFYLSTLLDQETLTKLVQSKSAQITYSFQH